jgi:hypothetical protein
MTKNPKAAILTIVASLIVLILIPLGMFLTKLKSEAEEKATQTFFNQRNDSLAAIENKLAGMPLPQFVDTIINGAISYHQSQLRVLPPGADSVFCRAMWIYVNASQNNFKNITEYKATVGDTVETYYINNRVGMDEEVEKKWSEDKKDTTYILSANIFEGKANCVKTFNNYVASSCFIFTRPPVLDSAGQDSICETLFNNGLRVYLKRLGDDVGCTINVQMIKNSSLSK